MSEQHAPGPWKVVKAGNSVLEVIDGTGTLIADVVIESPRGISNAHLIAAAPELLSAAKLIASFAVSWQPLTPGDIRELTSAIAKAEGR